jgi:uncharacterized protein (TIGR02145 family)
MIELRSGNMYLARIIFFNAIALALLLLSCHPDAVEGNPFARDGSSSSSSLSSSNVVIVVCPDYNSDTHFCDSRDGEVYRKVEIGSQVWMAENLKYNANNSECYDNFYCVTYGPYGLSYDWETAMVACPEGWHLPSNEEWGKLLRRVEMDQLLNQLRDDADSPIAGKYLKATNGWDNGGNGLDTYEFAALPGGYGYHYDPFGYDVGENGLWWTASEYNRDRAYRRIMYYNDDGVYKDYLYKYHFLSVRCVKN